MNSTVGQLIEVSDSLVFVNPNNILTENGVVTTLDSGPHIDIPFLKIKTRFDLAGETGPILVHGIAFRVKASSDDDPATLPPDLLGIYEGELSVPGTPGQIVHPPTLSPALSGTLTWFALGDQDHPLFATTWQPTTLVDPDDPTHADRLYAYLYIGTPDDVEHQLNFDNVEATLFWSPIKDGGGPLPFPTPFKNPFRQELDMDFMRSALANGWKVLGAEALPTGLSSAKQLFPNAHANTKMVVFSVRVAALTIRCDNGTPTAGANGIDYPAGNTYALPLNGVQAKLVKAIQNGGTATGYAEYWGKA